MADFDSIINVEEWISDYYLTTDEKGSSFGKRVVDAIKVWKSEEKVAEPPTTRLTSRREALQKALSSLSEETDAQQLHGIYDLFSEAFGYSAPRQISLVRGDHDLTLTASADKDLKTLVVRAKQLDALEDLKDLELLDVDPILGEKSMDYTASMLVRELFLTDKEPDFVLILAGNWVVIAEKERWPLGRYLAVNLALAIERNDQKAKGEMQRVTAILAAEHTISGADGKNWWLDTLEEARDHAVKVSEELRGAIKRSIEIIGNDVLDRHRAQGMNVEDLNGIELGNQALRYLYRILFLLFAESSPELQILPTGDNDYDEGYGLARLRDQILTTPTTKKAEEGTHLFDSLQLLFNLVNTGHDPSDPNNADYEEFADEGIQFRELDADLFSRSQTSYIDEVKLSNLALTKVLQNLLLTKEKRGSDRGFISYATLGVSELGQVYEGLMSFKGFIAKENLIEVAKNGDASKGSWVVPEGAIDNLPTGSVVEEEYETEHGLAKRARRHSRGSFVFRQSSRDRERSASFYSPPVITKFAVGQAIEELEATGRIDKADDILTLSICEPAMGSGAFAVEAVDQLAELYIEKKQKELNQEISGDERPRELQKVKAHIALHQVYGVDLNKTAVELAEISLWLNTMTADLKAPWFGLRLRHGNSLVGATRSTFTLQEVSKRDYLSTAPKHHPLTSMANALSDGERDTTTSGRVYHFLVPSNGWGAAADVDPKDIVGDEIKAEIKTMKNWQKTIRKGLNKEQRALALSLSNQAERLWEMSLVRLRLAEDQVRRDLKLFGQDVKENSKNPVLRKQIEKHLFDNKDSAYQRLRLAMNLWNALWYWPVTATEGLPSIDEYLAVMKDLLGVPNDGKKKGRQSESLGFTMFWEDLDGVEEFDRVTSGRLQYSDLIQKHPWVETAEQISTEQAFFHWDLDFATVMSKGGFDFQVGNPPWVRPRTDVDTLLSESDPWFNLAHKPTQAEKKARRELLVANPQTRETLSKGLAETVVTSAVLGDATRYPHLQEQQPDLYRGFMERTWANNSENGIISLIHPESHFTEKKAAPLRAAAYLRLRRHWHFINELKLFKIDHHVIYGVHVYGPAKKRPQFKMASSLYHPRTVDESFIHDGSGPLPGFKDDNNNWDLRPHKDRIITVDEDVLRVWNSILEEHGTPLIESRSVYSVNTEAAQVLAKLASAARIKELGLKFSSGWHESGDKKAGYFDTSWQHPTSWSDAILQGPHLGVATPMIKQPNPTMKHNQDWSEVDLEAMGEGFIPATAYAPNKEVATYQDDYGTWDVDGRQVRVIDQYRVAWRAMAATTGFRTMYPVILPPGAAHIHGIHSGGPLNTREMIFAATAASSFVDDFFLRSTGIANLYGPVFDNLPLGEDNALWGSANERYLRLNCLTSAYAPLWESVTGTPWTVSTPLRVAQERWHAQNEIDAMVALSLGVTLDELLMIYRTQFPVMRRYDQEWLYDANGRRVAGDVEKLQKKVGLDVELPLEARTWTHPQSGVEYVFEYPFAPLDREADLRQCYEKYVALLEAES